MCVTDVQHYFSGGKMGRYAKKQKQHSQHTSSLTNENTTNKNKNFDKKYVLKAHESKQDLRRLVNPTEKHQTHGNYFFPSIVICFILGAIDMEQIDTT